MTNNWQKSKLTPAIQAILGAAILCVLGPLAINMQGYTPISLQSVGVIIVPIAFGWRAGLGAILLYLLVGGFGLPVFADFKSGWGVFTGPTAGFLFGFVPTTILAGWWANNVKVQYARFFMVFLGSHGALLVCGIIGLFAFGATADDVLGTIKYLFPGLFIKSFFGAFIALTLKTKKDQVQ